MPSLPRAPFGRRAARARGADARRPSARSRASRSSRRPACAGSTSSARAPVDQAWLEERFDFHPLDYEDVFSRNQRPKVDEYDDYLFIVLHFPRYDKHVGAPERGRARPVRRPRLPDHAAQRAAAAGRVPVRALPHQRGAARAAVLQGPRLPALQDRRRLRRRLVPDAAQDGQQARAHRGGDLRGPARPRSCATSPTSSRRSSTSARSSARSAPAFRDLERNKARYIAEDLDIYFDDIIDASERVWDMLENYKEVVEALEATNESAIAHRTNETFRVLTAISRDLPAADADRVDLGHERRTSPASRHDRARSGSSSS